LTTDGLSRLFGAQFGPIKTARNAGMTLVNKFPFLKKQLILQAMGK